MPARKSVSTNSNTFTGPDILPGLIAIRATLTGGGPSPNPRTDGVPTDAEMVLINKFSRRGNLDPAFLYAFDCTPSTQAIDSYYTRMDVSSLINYAAESKLGRPLMNSHRTGGHGTQAELPIGKSFNGEVANDPQSPGQQLFSSSAYMLRNNSANGSINTDQVINAIEAGTVSDISIQFNFSPGTPEMNFTDRTWLRCSICGNDFLRSDPWSDSPDNCPHWPGEMYKSDGGQRTDMCVLDLVNGHLTEYSTVYAGATPGAVISKVRMAASEGFFNRSMVRHLEDAYHTRLLDYAVFSQPIPLIKAQELPPLEVPLTPERIENKEMANEQELPLELESEIEDASTAEAGAEADTTRQEGDGAGDAPQATQSMVSLALFESTRAQIQSLKDENTRLKKEARRLAPLVEIGQRAWNDLLTLTIESYGRAGFGDGEQIREMLNNLPFDHIITLRRQYEDIARKLFGQHDQDDTGGLILTGLGGRQTTPLEPNQPTFAQAFNGAAANTGTAINKRNDMGAYR